MVEHRSRKGVFDTLVEQLGEGEGEELEEGERAEVGVGGLPVEGRGRLVLIRSVGLGGL